VSNLRGTVKCDVGNSKDCIKECSYSYWPLPDGWITFPDGRHSCPKCRVPIPESKPLTVGKLFAMICLPILTAAIVAFPIAVQWIMWHGPEWLVSGDPGPFGLGLSSMFLFFVLCFLWYVCLTES